MKGYSVAYQPKSHQDFIAAAYAKYVEYLTYEFPGTPSRSESVPLKVVEITTEPVPKLPKRPVSAKSGLPQEITLEFYLEFQGTVEIPGDTSPSRTIESLESHDEPSIVVNEVEFAIDGLLAAFRSEFGFDEFKSGGSFNTTTGGAYKITEENFSKLIADVHIQLQLAESLSEIIPIPNVAEDLLSGWDGNFTRSKGLKTAKIPLDLNILLIDAERSNSFSYELDDAVTVMVGTLSGVILWVSVAQ